ncbi:ABC-type oligopeptide transporter ABCB9-like isoform X2 [Symsagittifera roscoffensis]|uniref:ABC-type oligopeptide transporter ABCB9-like isoform X2 n=1 Tax=Symsagittifera roscoffensis TaxID=84072 RepID=UPI00307B1C57
MEYNLSSSKKQSKISGRSFVGIAVALADAAAQTGVIMQFYYGNMFPFYIYRYTYQSSSAEMVSYSVFRSLFLFLVSILTLADSQEYPKRFRELNHFVLIINGVLAISVVAKILVFYGSAAYVSWLFWESCVVCVSFSVIHPITWRYVTNIDKAQEKKKQNADQLRRSSMDRAMTLIDDSRTASFADSGRMSFAEIRSAKVEKLLKKKENWEFFKAKKLVDLSWSGTLLFLIGFFSSVASGIVEIFIPYCQAKIVGIVVSTNLNVSGVNPKYVHFVIAVGLLMLAKSVLILLSSAFLSRAKDRLEYKIQSVLFSKLLLEKQPFFDRRSNESIMQRITGDVESTASIITHSFTTFVRCTVKSIVVFMFLVVSVCWELSFVMLCAVPVLIYITINYTYKVNELREEIDVNIDDGFEQVSECFRKIKTLKQFRTEKLESGLFTRRLKDIDRHKKSLSYRIGLFKGSLSFIQVALLFTILVYGGHLVMNDLVDGESFLIFLFMHPDMIEGIEEIGRTFTEIVQSYLWAMRLMDTLNKLYNSEEERKKEEKVDQRGGCRPRGGGGDKRRGGGNSRVGQWGIGEISDRATVRRLRGDGDIELQIRKRRTWQRLQISPTLHRPEEVRGSITFENVQFAYRVNKPKGGNSSNTSIKLNSGESSNVLQDISFSVEPGQVVALVGRSGCGKSTCLRLLSRMYEPNFGQILLDGRSIQDYESGFFHQQVVHVSSEVELLNRSIKENVQYGIMGASEIDLMKAAEDSNAKPYLEEFYSAWEETKVAHKVNSNKEHKLLLGRALIRKPQVVLIDEVAMRLDAEIEELFEKQLLRSSRSDSVSDINTIKNGYHPTIMIIAHKLSTIQKSDKIIVLDNGRVVGEGTHEELIGKCSVYLEIVRKQLNMIHSTERRKKYSSKMQPQLSRSKSSFKSQSSPIKHL